MAKYTGDFLKTKKLDIDEIIPEGELVLREPTRKQVFRIKSAGSDEEALMDSVVELAPLIVIDHNVEKDGVKMDTKELLTALFESLRFSTLFAQAVTGFFPSQKKSDEK
jgi:hypothetical protein